MLLKSGDKVHIITRRLFESDLRRHFVGEIKEATDVAVRLEGYVFVHEAHLNQYARRPERRVRVFGLADNGLIINVISSSVRLEDLSYQMSPQDRMIITDGKSFSLDINEFSATR
jgi:hypothetical protein